MTQPAPGMQTTTTISAQTSIRPVSFTASDEALADLLAFLRSEASET